MPKTRKPDLQEQIELAIQSAGSIGGLERLAGIGQTHDERYGFWTAYSHLPGSQSLDAGTAELKRRIRARVMAEGLP